MVQYNPVQYSTAQYSTVQPSTVQYNPVQYSTTQYSTVQPFAVQYNPLQYNPLQYNPVQPFTVHIGVGGYDTSPMPTPNDPPFNTIPMGRFSRQKEPKMKSYNHFLGQHAKNSQQKILYRQGAWYAANSHCLGQYTIHSTRAVHSI